jgi:hypothetical protein
MALMVLAISGIVGNIVGVFLGALLPEGALHDLLSKSLVLGFDPPLSINLWIVAFSFGFLVKLNFCSFIAMVLGLLLYKNA